MILLILVSFICAYILSVLFFRKMAKENNLRGTFMMLLGFVPAVNFIVASLMFVFNNETSKRFFE